ncbi:MAG: RNA polymerase sigma factor [Minicystis sp.]
MLARAIDEVPACLPEPGTLPAFDRIFADHAPLVWRALRRLGVRAPDIEDVCQEVFATVHRKLPSFDGRSTLSTWIYGICVRTAWNHRRQMRRRREELTDAPPEQGVEAPQIQAIEQRDAYALVDEVLDALDDEKRAVFVLYEIEELSMKDVARAVGCMLPTAYARLYAARRQFEAALRRAGAAGRLP